MVAREAFGISAQRSSIIEEPFCHPPRSAPVARIPGLKDRNPTWCSRLDCPPPWIHNLDTPTCNFISYMAIHFLKLATSESPCSVRSPGTDGLTPTIDETGNCKCSVESEWMNDHINRSGKFDHLLAMCTVILNICYDRFLRIFGVGV